MSIIISLFLIGISLSMDTFSVCLGIGTSISKNKIIFLSILIGILHFFMPLFGTILGEKIVNFLNVNVNLLLGLILLFIGIELLISVIKKEENNFFNLNIFNMFLISVSVSLDSFSTGLGLTAITSDVILSGVIFSVCAFSFTFMGLLIGKYSEEKLGIYGNILGIILLFILGIIHIFK